MISLNDSILGEVVNALVLNDPESREQYLIAINNESGNGVENSRHTYQWDYRYNTIVKIAMKYNLGYSKLERGNLWQAVYLIGPNNEIYVFFSSKNLRSIIRNGKDNHYLNLLNLFNENLDDLVPVEGQISLNLGDNCSNKCKDIETLQMHAREVVKMMENPPSKVIVIAFNKTITSTAEALVFNTKNEIVWTKDLTSLIKNDYRFVLNSDDVVADQEESRTERESKKKQIVRLKNNR
ncbi:DUF5986 family protein [Cytobacillus dafuensis]|uniref:Uncharacterized protein n=1 Tax=Cytobacillus dafuensis TaxID=1742359 RepID=A0A5B8ZCB6_CYTDA|nr:DUF5986 family protein [Cytobacillus dafuensis]QED49369.1 hypothetical protein FSZ17_20045 [Cytobacillus dafuensis]